MSHSFLKTILVNESLIYGRQKSHINVHFFKERIGEKFLKQIPRKKKLQYQVPAFFYYFFAPVRIFVHIGNPESPGLIQVSCSHERTERPQKNPLVLFHLAKINGPIHEPVPGSRTSHVRLYKKES
jgi:hypothetical protein